MQEAGVDSCSRQHDAQFVGVQALACHAGENSRRKPVLQLFMRNLDGPDRNGRKPPLNPALAGISQHGQRNRPLQSLQHAIALKQLLCEVKLGGSANSFRCIPPTLIVADNTTMIVSS